jgi:hypothetical protein
MARREKTLLASLFECGQDLCLLFWLQLAHPNLGHETRVVNQQQRRCSYHAQIV